MVRRISIENWEKKLGKGMNVYVSGLVTPGYKRAIIGLKKAEKEVGAYHRRF